MADEKLIFEIGFDLDGAVQVAIKDGKKAITKIQKELGKTPIQLDVDTKSLRAELKKLNDEWNKLSASQRAGVEGTKLREQYRALTLEANGYTSTLRSAVSAEDKATAAKQRATKATERQTNAYKTQSSYLQRLVQRMVAYASVTQAFSFIRNIREVTAEFELQRVALGSIIGDLNEANAMFEQIKAAAVKSPFQIKELVTYTKQLAAYKIESDELFETTQRLADVSAGLGVGLERLVLAYGQIRATGYLRASEVRQLTEAGIPIVEELAKKMSELRGETVSAAEVMGMISERAISFGMVKEEFDDMTSAGGMFYKMQEKQAETLQGQWNNLKDSIAIMYEEIGNTETAQNGIKGMIGLVKSLAENWRDVYSIAQSLSVAMGVYYVAMKNATMASKALSVAEATRLSTLRATTVYMPKFLASTKLAITLTHAYRVAVIKSATATGLLSKAFWSLTKAMLSNPYTAVLAALASLATLLLTTESRAKRLSKELSKIGEDGAIQIDQSARNFERLAKAIRESEDGSEKQTAALAELKRSYGELLPSQDKEIKALVQEKANYDSLIKSIKRKIELQIQEQKINKIASEYGTRISGAETDFKSLLAQYGLTKEDANKVTSAVKDAIDAGLLSVNNSAKENAHKLKMIIKEQTGLDMLKGVFDPMQVFTQKYGKEMRNEFGNLVGVMSEYNAQIEEVGGSLDHLDDKGQNLSDTFNTWQKELASITEGKNLKGEGIRLFDDESITQINKLTDATARVAEEYDKLAKEKKEVDKALKSEGAKADKDTYAKLQERLGKINEGMSGLYNFLKKYGGLDLIKDGDKGGELARLQKELQLHEKIYAKYKEYRQYMSAEEAKAKVEDYFGDTIDALKFKPSFDKSGYQSVLEQYKKEANALLAKAKDETEKASIKKFLLDIGFKIGDKDWEETKDNMEKSLKKLSDDLSRTKTAKEFFDRMLGMTGDKQLSATLTLSVYGTTGDDLKSALVKQVEQAFKGVDGNIDVSDAIDYNTMTINYQKLAEIYAKNQDKILDANKSMAESIVKDGQKTSASQIEQWAKELEAVKTYADKRVDIARQTQQRISEIEASTLPEDEKQRLKEQYRKKEEKDLSKLEYQAFKESPMYVAMFDNLDSASTTMLNNMRAKLMELKEAWGDLDMPTELKEMQSRLNEIDKQLASRNPFKTLANAYKGYQELREQGSRKEAEQDLIDKTEEHAKAVAQLGVLTRSAMQAQKEYDDAVKKHGKDSAQAKSYEQLVKYSNALVDGQTKTVNTTEDAVEASQELVNKWKELDDVVGGAWEQANMLTQSIINLGRNLADAFGGFGSDADAEYFNTMLDSFSNLASGITSIGQGIATGDPIAIINGIGSAISGLAGLFTAGQVRKANKEIERQQESLDNLAYSYERLEKAQEKAFGSDYISNYEQRLANLQAQQEAYLKQADAERSKGKKADSDKIKEYEEQARETADAIKDMQSELSEYFLGTDLTSAARDFANAWIDAYKEFGSTTDAMKAKFQDMIQNMIVESFAAKVIQSALSDIFTEIDNMTKDGVLDVSEASKIADMTEVAVGNIDVGMNNLMNALSQAGISVRGMGSELTGISRDIATASEESILGLAAGINTQNFYISQVPTKLDTIISLLRGDGAMPQGSTITLQDVMIAQNQYLSHLPSIAQHTAETVVECKRTADACEAMVNKLNSVIKPQGTEATHRVATILYNK